jgi:hypothetical protein
MTDKSFTTVARRWALSELREAEANWQARNWYGAVACVWQIDDLARRCLWDCAPTLLRELMVAMLEQDGEQVAHCRLELEVYLRG